MKNIVINPNPVNIDILSTKRTLLTLPDQLDAIRTNRMPVITNNQGLVSRSIVVHVANIAD